MGMLRMVGIGAGLIGAGYLAARMGDLPARKGSKKRAMAPVRDAGVENMTNPPGKWDKVDQQADESFPASDPPGNY